MELEGYEIDRLTMATDRIIGWYTGNRPGPLVVCLGGIHGNEPAGVEALEILIQRLQEEPRKNPGFEFHGALLALRGNLAALQAHKRYLNEDLNRAWNPKRVAALHHIPEAQHSAEEREIQGILHIIRQTLAQYPAPQLVFLDFHTNSAPGGIFGLPGTDAFSRHIASGLHAPAVHGLLQAIDGAALGYFLSANWGIPVSGLAFEAGQHQDPESPRRALAAVINCLRSIGCVRPHDVNNEHDTLLRSFSKGLPANMDIFWREHIEPEDQFRMKPGFHNFDRVHRGQLLAENCRGPIYAPADCRILMPLYQAQGEDGFFLIRENFT